MNKVDRYFPYAEDDGTVKNETVDMNKVSEVIKVQIDNAMKSVVEELKNNIKEKEKESNDNNFESKQGVNKEGEVSPNTEPGHNDNPES